jgi:hypothetical protein
MIYPIQIFIGLVFGAALVGFVWFGLAIVIDLFTSRKEDRL